MSLLFKYKKMMLKLARKQVYLIETEHPGHVTGKDDAYCKLYQRCDDWYAEKSHRKLAIETLIRTIKRRTPT